MPLEGQGFLNYKRTGLDIGAGGPRASGGQA